MFSTTRHNPIHTSSIFFLVLGISFWTLGCAERTEPPTETEPTATKVEVIARGLQFEAPDEIPSGWTTFRFINESEMTHFVLIERLPEGIGVAEQQEEVAPIFQQGMDLINGGQMDEAFAKFGELPAWFGEVGFAGGPGLTAAGRTAETTVYLEPGTYLMECYVKTNGIFHSYNPAPDLYGMVHEFAVTADSSGSPEPVPSIRVTISSETAIEVEGTPTVGEHIIAVHYKDQKPHENFLGHDVHLARLQESTDLEQLAAWMDWSHPAGLETPAPVDFLGGNHEMPAGSTGYIHVTFEPGRYAWIAETTNPREKGMLVVFEVEG